MMKKKMPEYIPRISDRLLEFKLKSKGAVLIEGPKWCGKTTSARQVAKSVMEFGDSASQEQNIEFATINTSAVLEGEVPRLFDEWQEVPALWDAVRYEVDRRNKVGQFILTGSTVPVPKNARNAGATIRHTGTGRYAFLRMRPMSLFESGESTGEVSLAGLFEAPEEIAAQVDFSLEELAFVTCRGGWPFAVFLEGEYALAQAKDYYEALVHQDISSIDGVRRDPNAAAKLLRSYARLQATSSSNEYIAKDTGLSADTVASYLAALRRIFAVEDLGAWSPKLRSKTAIRASATRYFVDPSIAVAALGATPEKLLGDLNTFGLLFEALCVRDLRVYMEALGGEVLHYRDKNGLECDAVVVLPDGRYGLIEIKLGQDPGTIAAAAKTLNALADLIVPEMPPAFKMLLTGNGTAAYRRPEDGVYVVPVASLGD